MSPKKLVESHRLGLMGGSFNPIHYGHLTAAEEAIARFNLDKIIFIPCGKPPHKDVSALAPAEDRYLMTAIAIANDPRFEVSRYEIDKPGPSYTIDTMRHFKEELPDTEFYFITGADAALELDTWREPEQIYKYGHLIGATRPGYTVDKAPAVAERVIWMEIPALGVSSTDIRQRLRDNLPVTNLLPAGVLEYIKSRSLYQG
ncbi:MAG: nicotinate-nucleotide adenylyltransferase [Actinomycetota bacterium]